MTKWTNSFFVIHFLKQDHGPDEGITWTSELDYPWNVKDDDVSFDVRCGRTHRGYIYNARSMNFFLNLNIDTYFLTDGEVLDFSLAF